MKPILFFILFAVGVSLTERMLSGCGSTTETWPGLLEATIDPTNHFKVRANRATCLECIAEDENQKLNEAVAELQGLTSPAKKPLILPAQR